MNQKVPSWAVSCWMEQSGHARSTKRPFTLEEDKVLLRFVFTNGPRRWGQLVAQLQNRTPKQCRERWNNQLNPRINESAWSPDEDEILTGKHAMLGNHWVQIARYLPGRTDMQVKNRWTTTMKTRTPGCSDSLGAILCDSVRLQSWLDAVSGGKCGGLALVDMDSMPPLNRTKD
jgi:myb proto-oncogene protein